MNCPKCGSQIAVGNKTCPRCGHRISYGGNTEFFRKAAVSKLSLGDVFSDVFKPHSKRDGERMFLAGTSLTTPTESEMLSQWKKPYLFARVGGVGILFILLMYIIIKQWGVQLGFIPLVFVGATIMPLAVLLFFWEMNIPRNIPIYEVLMMFFIGGGISLILTLVMNSVIGDTPAYLAPLTEEPAKLLALCLFLRKPKYKYTLNGLLIGAAIGTGFGAIESMSYAMRADDYIQNLLARGLLAPGMHVAWAAMYGGALAALKGRENLQLKHFADINYLSFFGGAFLLHLTWNSDFKIIELPLIYDLKYLLLIAAAWFALLSNIKKGTQQVLRVSSTPPAAYNYNSQNPSALFGVSGAYKNSSFPLSGRRLIFGRDPKKVNIVFSQSSPGISSVHCELRNEGDKLILIDRGSSYGTFLSNGEKLVPNKAYVLRVGDKFYLANHNNEFEVM